MADAPRPERSYAGLDVTGYDDAEMVLAGVDDWSPTAVDDSGPALRIFFNTVEDRDAAAIGLATAMPHVSCVAVDVPDEHWAERSQAALTAIRATPGWGVSGSAFACLCYTQPSRDW